MLKTEARKTYREKRQSISAAEKNKLDDLLLIQFQTLELPFLHTVLSYWPIEENNEPDSQLVVDFLAFRNPSLNLAYPKMTVHEQNLQAVLVEEDTAFKKEAFNVPEPLSDHVISPEAFDLVIVPLLISDKQGYRVGYGKGFYDRFLKQCRPDCIKLGLMYFDPIDELEDKNEFDVPLNICVTPGNTYVF
jgi:5-formyltetrahydrofolate cyclo-ligase